MATIAELHVTATAAAVKAAQDYIDAHGEPYYCGFAWVKIGVERTNSTLAKEFLAIGFTKDYLPRMLQLWNPSLNHTQSLDVKYAGAEAYAKVFQDAGYKVYPGSRAD